MSQRLIFGIYPGSGVGIDPGSGPVTGPADDARQITTALDRLASGEETFLVRGYMHFTGGETPANLTPADMRQYVRGQRKLDLALCYRSARGEIEPWASFIRRILPEYGPFLAKLQITEEPNNPDTASGGDGSSPNIHRAITSGVLAAKDEAKRLGLAIQVGFNATPSFDPENAFWKKLAEQAEMPAVLGALDYVGLDFFPDVFHPLPPGLGLAEAVRAVLAHYRRANLAAANIPPEIPIHITENGWPTGPNRSPARQAEVLTEVLDAVAAVSSELNVTHYEYFDLRDADSSAQGLNFGLLYDDYTPKPAFDVFRSRVRG